MNRNGYVEKLLRYPEKKGQPVQEECLICTEGKGIEGDFHAGGGDRQISLMGTKTQEWMKAQEIQGLCFQRYSENILLGETDISELQPGDLLVFEEAVLEVAAHEKRCFPDICELAATEKPCRLAGTFCFAFVKKSGMIRKGETFECFRSTDTANGESQSLS